MKIVIAPDSFKESLSAFEVAKAIQAGFQKVYPNAEYMLIPMADGGEGTVQSLIDALDGRSQNILVHSPLGEPVIAAFGLSGDRKIAVIEMAAASGLHLVPMKDRNPLKTTSYGTGELIKEALNCGVEKIILGIGGSATNDAGVGMLQALGARFLDQEGKSIGFGGEALARIMHIDLSELDPRLQNVHIEVACDVDNLLCGENGASAVFSLQKGATPKMAEKLDHALAHFATIVQQTLGLNIKDQKGSGAAGGMGGGLLLLPNVELKSGVQIVLQAVEFSKKVQNADLVITGEGRMDGQSIRGKTPVGIALAAKVFGKPVIAIVGSLREDYETVYQYGIDVVFPIIRQVEQLDIILKSGKENLISTAQNVAKLWQLTSK